MAINNQPNQQPDNTQQPDPSEDDKPAELAPDEQYASDEEMQILYKVMAQIFKALQTGFHGIQKIMRATPNLSKTVGDMTFHVCSEVFASAAKAKQPLPVDIFMMQGGAVYQTIDALGDLAESSGLKFSDEDAKNALGWAVAGYMKERKDMGNISPADFQDQAQGMESRAGIPAKQVPDGLSGPVSQGLKSQGLQNSSALGSMQ